MCAYLYYLSPVPHKMGQAIDILCSGTVDFVYSEDPSTKIVWAARSFAFEDKWSKQQQSIMQLMGATLPDHLVEVSMGPLADKQWAMAIDRTGRPGKIADASIDLAQI